MTRDDVIRMACEAGVNFYIFSDDYCDAVGLERGTTSRLDDIGVEEFERFAALVAAAEREACAQVCDAIEDKYQRTEGHRYPELKSDAETGAGDCAFAIRERSAHDQPT